jgi:hypothetical protein
MDTVEQERSRPNVVLGLAAAVAIGCVALAVWSMSSAAQNAPTTLPVVESHGLTVDQATCLDLATVMSRSQANDLEVTLGKYQGLDPVAELDLRREIAELDSATVSHPEADRRLVTVIREVADDGSAVIAASDSVAYRTAVTGWAASASDARSRCLELADFDVEALDIRQSGR